MDKMNKLIFGLGGLADKELETEREIIRQKYYNPEYDVVMRISF